MSQFFTQPCKVNVRVDDQGNPVVLYWRYKSHPVKTCNHWRLAGDWWRHAYAREYYQLLTRSGSVCLVYRDAAGAWYLQKMLD